VDQYRNFLKPDGAIDPALFSNQINNPKATGGRMKLDRSTENLLAFNADGSKSVPNSATGAAQGDAKPAEEKSSWWPF